MIWAYALPAVLMCSVEEDRAGISLTMKAASVSRVLQRASELGGASLSAEPEVSGLRVSVFVHDLPLTVFRDRLAEVLHCSWREVNTDKGDKGLLLYKSRRDRAEEARLFDRREARFREQLQLAVHSARMDPDEQTRFLRDHPALARMMQSPQFGNAMSVLSGQPGNSVRSLADGQSLEIDFDRSAPGVVNSARAFVRSQSPPSSNKNEHETSHLRIERSDSGGSPTLLAVASGNGGTRGLRLHLPSSEHEEYEEASPPRRDAEYREAREPRLVREMIAAKTFDEILQRVAETFRIDVMAESYITSQTFPLNVPPGRISIERALDSLMEGSQVWWKSADVYLFQRATWFLDRLSQVSDEDVKRVKERFESGRISLEDWAELTRFRPQQWMMLQTLRAGQFDGMVEHHGALKLVNQLSPLQKQRLFERSGLPLHAIKNTTKQALARWVARGGTGVDSTVAGSLLRAKSEDGQTSLSAYGKSGAGPLLLLRQESLPAIPRYLMEPPKTGR